MANRIGKYKLSKKEAALSLADGGEIKGSLTGLSDSQFTIVNPVSGSDADISVTKATHGGRVTFVPNVSADRTYTFVRDVNLSKRMFFFFLQSERYHNCKKCKLVLETSHFC